jgi:hypothetical protein
MKTLWTFLSLLALASPFSLAQGTLLIRMAVTGSQLAAANATEDPTRASPGRLGVTAEGKLLLSDFSDPANNEIFLVDVSVAPPVFTKVTDTATLKKKVDDANGPDPAPTAMTPQTLDVDSDGHVIILTDGADPEVAYLFHVDQTVTPPVVTLVSGLDRPFLPLSSASSIEGNRSMAVIGHTAYITLNDRFNAFNGDSIVKIDVHSPDGGKTAAMDFVSQSQLEAVVGVGQDIDLNDIAVRPAKGTLVAINSGRAQSNDDLLEIDPRTGVVSLLVAATDIEADLATTDVGYSGIDIGTNDVIYLANAFGTSGQPPHRGIIAIANAGGGRGDATLFASQAEIIASPTVRTISGAPITSLSYQNAGLAVSPTTGEVFFVERNTSGVIGLRRQ